MIIAVDFDGTIVKNRWPEIGELKWFSKKILKWLRYRNHKLILYTCRTKDLLTKAIDFCLVNDIRFHSINMNLNERICNYGDDCRKISADWYIDDKAGFLGWWSIPIIILYLEWKEKRKRWIKNDNRSRGL